jgi:hypothetical protein
MGESIEDLRKRVIDLLLEHMKRREEECPLPEEYHSCLKNSFGMLLCDECVKRWVSDDR